jgi:hypothetical protein
MRLTLDSAHVPEIRMRREALTRSQIRAARAIVRRGIDRGDLPRSTSGHDGPDALCGGAMMPAMSAPRELRDRVVAGADAYAERFVDFVLGSKPAAARRPAGRDPAPGG